MARGLMCAAALLVATTMAHQAAPTKLMIFKPEGVTIALSAAYSVSVSPSSGLVDRTWVNVTYSSPSPGKDDLVIAYSPLPTSYSSTSPIEWFSATADPAYLTTGSGSIPARLLNFRDTISFVLATGSADSPTVRAISAPVTFTNPNEPRGARLALTGSTTEMRISWYSRDATGGPAVTIAPAAVWAKTQAGSGAGLRGSAAAPGFRSLPAQSITWNASDLCGAPAATVGYRTPGFVHTVVATGLVPGQQYTYTVGDATGTLGPYTFMQPPLGNSPAAYPFVFTAVGDMGQLTTDGSDEVYPFPPAPNTTRYVARDIAQYGSRAHFHIGDLSYARGYASEWDLFWNNVAGDNLISPLVPYMVNLGNHERDFPSSAPSGPSWLFGTDSGGECGVPTVKQFLMPSPDGVLGSKTALWWAAAVGPVYTVHFSSELDTTPGGPLWSFVKSSLAGVDRSVTPWVVVCTHRPMYISSTNVSPDGGDQTVATVLRQNIEPLLMNAGGAPVDLFLQGHHHSYQRGSAVFNMTVMSHSTGPDNVYQGGLAPVQMVIGTGGAGFSTNIQTPQPAWAERVEFWYGHARITAHNASALQWEFINDADGSVADAAWIVK